MNYADATKVLAASAACQMHNGCDYCPLYNDFVEAGRPEGYCKSFASYENVLEAVKLIKQVGILNSISIL